MKDSDNIHLQTDQLSIAINGQMIFSDVTTEFKRNTITTLVGRSGCGKTTFLRCLNRLIDLNDNVDLSGDITINLQNGDVNDINSLRQKVGMLFQIPHVLPMSVHKNIALPLQVVKSYYKSQLMDKIQQVLVEVGLWDEVKDRLHQSAEALSGGQQQRLCLAHTLALEPEILLLDEPTSSLDFVATQRIETLLQAIKSKYTIIMVSHNIGQAMNLSDHIYLFADQRVQWIDKDSLQDKKWLHQRFDEAQGVEL